MTRVKSKSNREDPGYAYQCADCRLLLPGERLLLRCPHCGGVLLIRMELRARQAALKGLLNGRIESLWKYAPFLPLSLCHTERFLQEGGTPLLEAGTLAAELDLPGLVIKNETVNPTGSFKDRQVAVGMMKALESGLRTVAVVSSGNVAASASALAARLGCDCLVFVPQHAPAEKLLQAAIYGARIYKVATDSSAKIMQLVEAACRQRGWFHLSTAGSINPFSVQGSKTIAYEIYEQSGGRLPDRVIVPVGGGGLLGGIWRGFLDLRELEIVKELPRLIGVQAAGCAPLVRGIQEGMKPNEIMQKPWENPRTIAGGIADDILFDAHRALPAIRDSGGLALAVTDHEIVNAQQILACREGLFAEPSGAVSIAGLIRLHGEGKLNKSDRVCCLVTGAGLKDMRAVSSLTNGFQVIQAELSAVLARLP